ncbi:MAG: hypothetical protein M3P51_17770 [Chloroflexota bacterium]|nr:hypothetical protein [Chloroflexota bacterium]
MGWDRDSVEQLVEEGVHPERRWIDGFSSFACDGDGKAHLEFWLSVDWDKYGQLVVSHELVEVDERWEGDLSPALLETAQVFAAELVEHDWELRVAYLHR